MAESKDHKMLLRDDSMYTIVEYEVGCYPRIEYFKTELKDVFSRFQRLYEGLPENVTLSADNLGSIIHSVQNLINSTPMLFLFGPSHAEIYKGDSIYKGKPKKIQTAKIKELHHLDEHAKNFRMVLAMCTLSMMNTMKGQDVVLKVTSCFGAENIMFYVDKVCELNLGNVANTLANLGNVLKRKKEELKIVYESDKEIILNVIKNHMEHKFANTFVLLNKFILQITKTRNRTKVSRFGDKLTGRRFYRHVKRQFENVKTLTDLLVTSNGESTEEKLATAIVALTQPLLITEIADTYEMQDVQVFDYCQKENLSDIWKSSLQTHLLQVPLVRQLDQFVRAPNDESVRRDVERNYTQNDARTIGRLVTRVLMGYFLQVGNIFRKIRLTLDDLTALRKELQRLIEETVDGDKYVECVPNLEHWRTQLTGIMEVQGIGLVLGKLVVLVNLPDSTEREREVCTQIQKLLKGFPSEVVVEVVTPSFFAGRHGTETFSKVSDACRNKYCICRTIDIYMHGDVIDCWEYYGVTNVNVALGSNAAKINDQNRVKLGTTIGSSLLDSSLIDNSTIQNCLNGFSRAGDET